MKGDVDSVDSYLKVLLPNMPGPALNFGTWQSAVREFDMAKLPPWRWPLHYSTKMNSWCLAWIGNT